MSLTKIQPICEEIRKRGLVYRCNAQALYSTRWGDEMARLLAATGCREIAFGAESGSKRSSITLSSENLHTFRDYLVSRYRPRSHTPKWTDQDRFFDQGHVGGPYLANTPAASHAAGSASERAAPACDNRARMESPTISASGPSTT